MAPKRQKTTKLIENASGESLPSIRINSELIKRTETLPQELNGLIDNAYNENEFEAGVMLQVDMQLAEFELDKAKKQMKILGVSTESDSRDSSSSNEAKKRPGDKLHAKTIENLQAKKAKLASTLDEYKSYMSEASTSKKSEASSKMSEQERREDLVKRGEMTPFGSVLDVNKEKQSEDFNSFLLGFDEVVKEKAMKKSQRYSDVVKKQQHEKKKEISTKLTEFDHFLMDFDKKKEDKVTKITKKKVVEKKEEIKKDVVEQRLNEFDQFFEKVDSDKTKMKSKKSDKLVEEAKERPKREKRNLNKNLSENSAEKKETANENTLSFVKLFEDDEDNSNENGEIEANIDAIDDESNENDDENDKDYVPSGEESEEDDNGEDKYEESDLEDDGVEFETDSDEDSSETGGGRKLKRQRRNALDDGDEKLWAKRMKNLDKVEKKEREDNICDLDEYCEIDGGLKMPVRIWNRLYKFQKTGVKWLWELNLQKCGGILGDEMGLGKTIQIISFLTALKFSKVRNPDWGFYGLGATLIVAPTTLIAQWVQEFHNWWPYHRVAVLHEIGTFAETPRSKLIERIVACNGVLITTYSGLLVYEHELLAQNWHYVILDEGHKIRNPDAKVTITAKCFRTPNRIILSASPIQNNLKELWSLFDFIFPGKLGTLTAFMENFSVPIVQGGYANATEIQVKTAYKCASVLKDTITPYLLRRIKSDIQSTLDLPTKNEQVLFCRLSDEQKDEYIRYVKSKECVNVVQNKKSTFKALMHLRKLCNHVDLVATPDNKYEFSNGFGYYKRAGKMIVVETLLRLWKKQDNRVLLFSQSRKMLDIIQKFVEEQGYEYLRMDGTTAAGSRSFLVNKFNTNPQIFIFLLTTKVGGIGLNLTSANRVIIYDPDWNPSTDMQARERAWRIGQTKGVTIYRLLTTGTIEEKIYHRQIFKQFLTNKVLKDPRQKRFFKTNDLYELFSCAALEENASTETSDIFVGTGSEVTKPKKSRKSKDSRIDGEKVPNLAKTLTKDDNEKDDRESRLNEDKLKDDYVLSKLFKVRKKDGQAKIHTAMQHDMIVESSEPDFALIEAEAERVAQDAVKALKNSRRLCHSAESGVPNLSGIRFGENSKFGGDAASSASLINRIKMRNNVVVPLNDEKKVEDEVKSESEKFLAVAKDIREFVLFGAKRRSQARTQEIVEHFKEKLKKYDAIKFKAVLQKVCKMCTNEAGEGVWRLREEDEEDKWNF